MLNRINGYIKAITPPEPESYTPNTVVHETDLLKLLMYRLDTSNDATLIICPDAGHGGIGLADKGEDQSLVRTIMSAKKGSVFVLEWKGATQVTKNATLEDIIDEIWMARWKASGFNRTHIFGLCAGGWKAAIFTAMYPQTVSRLSINGAPINFRACGGHLADLVDSIPQSTYEMMVQWNNGVMSGDMMLLGWKMMNARERFLSDYIKLWDATLPGNESDYDRIYAHRAWYENTRDIPGPLYLRTINDLFRHNKLIKKELYIGNKIVDLKNITCPVDVINGDKDNITLVSHCFALADEVSTPAHLITRTIMEGVGHIGGFCSRKAQPILHDLFSPEPIIELTESINPLTLEYPISVEVRA